LADGREVVIVVVLEVNKANSWAFFARLPVLADAGVFQQQMQQMFVVFEQAAAGKAGRKLLDDLLDLVVLQPGAVGWLAL
jgi:hypothetical protein